MVRVSGRTGGKTASRTTTTRPPYLMHGDYLLGAKLLRAASLGEELLLDGLEKAHPWLQEKGSLLENGLFTYAPARCAYPRKRD